MAMTPEDMTHLNFMKKQQWNVAYYALLLLAAVFAVKQAFRPLVDDERRLLTVLCALVLVLGIFLLSFIQCDIGKLRKHIGLDPDAYTRGPRVYVSAWADHVACLLHRGLWDLVALTVGT
jgi:hypothetical protein